MSDGTGRSRRWRAAAFAGLALLAILAAAGYAISSWTGAQRDASRSLWGETRLLATTVRWRLRDDHAALASLGQAIAHLPRLDRGGGYLRIGRLGRRFMAQRRTITALAVLGPHGSVWWRAPAGSSPIPGRGGASRWARGRPAGAFRVGRPRGDRGVPLWLTVRARHHVRFLIWALWSPGLGGAVRAPTAAGLVWGQGPVIAMGPSAPMPAAAVRILIAGHRPAGHLTVDLGARPARWFGAYRRVPGYPFAVFALRPRAAVYARAHEAAFVAALWLGVVLAALAVVYRAVVRGERRMVGERMSVERRWPQAKIEIEGIVQSLAEAVFATDCEGRIEYLNRAAEKLTGWTCKAVQQRVLCDILPCLDEYRGSPFDPVAECLAGQALVSGEALVFHQDGHGVAVEYDAAPRYGPGGRLTGVVLSLRDAANKRVLTERLAHQATHDPLTELGNRILFHERLERAVAEVRTVGGAVALLFLDVDGFKRVNDTLGHSTGDRVLVLIAERLRRVVRTTDTLARLGGDEFAVVLPGLRTGQDALPVVHKIMAAFREPLVVALGEIVLGVSIGIAVYPYDSSDSRALVRAADAAMYEAKAAGKNTYRFFASGDTNRLFGDSLTLAADLRQALERDEFSLVYQPQVQTANRQLVAMEALLRWTHPTEGVKYPGEFLAALEEAGLMIELGTWVLQSACRQNRRWRDLGLGAFPVAVNMSGDQCAHEGLTEMIDAVLKECGLRPDDLVLELSEELLVDAKDPLAERLQRLREGGVRLVVQNFGGASSTLGTLRRLRVEALKIEAAFIAGIGDEYNNGVVVAIIALARALSLKVIAGGVESAAQYRFLREAACDAVQGHYVAAPLDVEAATAYLRAHEGTRG